MKKKFFIIALLIVSMLFSLCACGTAGEENEEAQDPGMPVTDYLAQQAQIDASLIAEAENGYSFDEPLVVVNPYGNAPLSAVVIFTTDEEIGGQVCVNGKSPEDNIISTFKAEKTHFVPVIGLYAGETTDVTLTLDNGKTTSLQVETEPLELGPKNYSAQMYDAEKYDYSDLTICSTPVLNCGAGYDSKGDLRWAIKDVVVHSFTPLENGHFVIAHAFRYGAEFPYEPNGIWEMDCLGKVYNTYVWDGGEHHAEIIMPNGNYMTLVNRPGADNDPELLFEVVPETGEIVWQLDMAEVIEPGSSGCKDDNGGDWCHANALAYDKESDTILVSCRNLCAVVAINYTTKQLQWILGDPAGWSDEYAPYLLKSQGENFDWSYGQHQISILSNGDLLLFDNGEYGRVKHVNEDKALADADNFSRAVIYRIDPAAKTVSQVWEYGRQFGSECFSNIMSGVQMLDEAKSRFLICFGNCKNEDGNYTHIKLVEDEQVVWQMDYSVFCPTYRACRFDLAANSSYDPYAEAAWHGDLGTTKQLEHETMNLSTSAKVEDWFHVDLYPFNALYFSGSFVAEDESLLTDYQVLLVNADGEQFFYDLGYTKSNAQDGTLATLNRWVSLNGLAEGQYHIYVVMNGAVYDSECSVNVK